MTMLPVLHVMESRAVGWGAYESCKVFTIKQGNCRNLFASNIWKSVLTQKITNEQPMKSVRSVSCKHHVLKALTKADVSVLKTPEKVVTYRFGTEIGGQLMVLVKRKNNKYGLYAEVISFPLSEGEDKLIMVWGLFRSDSTSFMPLDFQKSGIYNKHSTIETPFLRNSAGNLELELDFDASSAPFYVSILLKCQGGTDLKIPTIRSHRETSFVVPVGFDSGHPFPLGVSFLEDGSINLAFISRDAESVVLCLYTDTTADKPALEIDLDPYVNRSGDVWHALIYCSMPFVSYGYRCGKESGDKQHRVLLDPYAKIIEDCTSPERCRGTLHKEPAFDWNAELRPDIPMEKLIVYRLNVKQFTEDKSCKLSADISGSFDGISEKLQHFKDLGVNAILLEPIFPFDMQKGPYYPWHFFSPGSLYGPSGNLKTVAKSLKEMVKKLHNSRMEVLLEVVFTHTAEGAPLRQIDNSYYHVRMEENLKPRNSLNCNHPLVQQMIIESLRHWVIEFHIDGFCFINANSLMKGLQSEFLSRPPLVEAIAFDPVLSKVKIIADSWDPHDMETKEIEFAHWKRWAEMNAKFCVDVRNFMRGQGPISNLATRLCGSGDLFLAGRGPAFSFNFITRNVGFTLVDLVSFSRNEVASHLSWNCGEEGPTNKTMVLETRLKQIRNFLFILFISLGVPVLNMGDECGQSSGGSLMNVERKPFNWNALKSGFSIQITQFISFLSSLKIRRSDLLQRRSFLREMNIEWLGAELSPPKWDDPSCKFLAVTLKAESTSDFPEVGGDLFVAFNNADGPECVALPLISVDMTWVRLVDTALPYPGFFTLDGVSLDAGVSTYEMKPHSCILLEARSL